MPAVSLCLRCGKLLLYLIYTLLLGLLGGIPAMT